MVHSHSWQNVHITLSLVIKSVHTSHYLYNVEYLQLLYTRNANPCSSRYRHNIHEISALDHCLFYTDWTQLHFSSPRQNPWTVCPILTPLDRPHSPPGVTSEFPSSPVLVPYPNFETDLSNNKDKHDNEEWRLTGTYFHHSRTNPPCKITLRHIVKILDALKPTLPANGRQSQLAAEPS